MSRTLPIVVALALVIATGLVHGQWTRRWTTSRAIDTAVARLPNVSLTLGEWRGEPLELSHAQLTMAEIDGYIARRYTDRRGTTVMVLLVCGRPGPISVHTPDICYAGAGYEPMETPTAWTLPVGLSGRAAGFRHAIFAKSNAVTPVYLQILWSWSSSGIWEAPDNPRLSFAARPALYKLYVIRETATATTDARRADDPSRTFLAPLLSELDRVLFMNPGSARDREPSRDEPPSVSHRASRDPHRARRSP